MKKVSSINEKIKNIKKSKRIEDLKLEVLPVADENEYFLVSYSHKDYKEVYSDILRLQEKGIHVWYDKGRLPAGEEWFKVVGQKITNYSCKGVIFYISENTIKHSEQVERELEIVLNSKKPFLSINLPLKSIDKFKGRYFSAKEIINIYNKPVSLLSKVFTDERIYLKYSDDPLDKSYELNKIKEKSSAIVYSKNNSLATVTATKDPYITKVFITKYIENVYDFCAVNSIGTCAFANCGYLQSVVLGEDIERIGEYAFYGCVQLKEFVLQNAHIYEIGEKAFSKCKSLTRIDLSNNRDISQQHVTYVVKDFSFGERPQKKSLTIGANAFWDSGIETIIFPKDTEIHIGTAAFGYSKLRHITLPGLTKCDIRAFASCKSLESVTIEEGITELKARQFEGCYNIKHMSIPSTLIKIDKNFMGKEFFAFNHIEVAENNPVYRAENNCLIEREGERLISWHQGAKIPSTVKIIGAIAFKEQFVLDDLIIPEGVEIIEDGAFDCLCFGCVTFPKSIKKIGYSGGLPSLSMGSDADDFNYNPQTSLLIRTDKKVFIKGGQQESKRLKLENVETRVRFLYKGTVLQMNKIVNKDEIKKGNKILIECSDGVFEYFRKD